MVREYFKFSGRMLVFMYLIFAFTAFVHEFGHAMVAWLLGEQVLSISIGSGPLLMQLDLLQVHAWLCGGLTGINWQHTQVVYQVLVVLAGSISVLLWAGLFWYLSRKETGRKKYVFLCIAMMMLVMIGADLCPIATTDGSILNTLLGVSIWHPVMYQLWITACYTLQFLAGYGFFHELWLHLCPSEIQNMVHDMLYSIVHV